MRVGLSDGVLIIGFNLDVDAAIFVLQRLHNDILLLIYIEKPVEGNVNLDKAFYSRR